MTRGARTREDELMVTGISSSGKDEVESEPNGAGIPCASVLPPFRSDTPHFYRT